MHKDSENSTGNESIYRENVKQYFNGDQLAADVWWQKYRAENEIHPLQMINRLCDEITKYGVDWFGKCYPHQNDDMSKHGKELFGVFMDFKTSENSDIKREKIEKMISSFVHKNLDGFKRIILGGSMNSGIGVNDYSSLSNCLVLGAPEDSYAGILWKDHELVECMKRRCGVGLDLSKIRPSGAEVKNQSSVSCGVSIFMERYSQTTKEVSMHGRRGALMQSISCNHPDLEQFIKIKRDKTKVTGSNISVMMTDEFMEAVEQGKDFVLRFPTDKPVPEHINTSKLEYDVLFHDEVSGMYFKRVDAERIFQEFVQSNWEGAEPGLLFASKLLNYSPDSVYPKYTFITCNPCGEQPLPAYDCCRLLALNMSGFVKEAFTDSPEFDMDEWYSACYEQMIIGNFIVDIESAYIQRIIDKIENGDGTQELKDFEANIWKKIKKMCDSGRRCGCGIMGLGDTLAMMNLPYSITNVNSKSLVKLIMETKMRAELDASIDMAILSGKSFDGYSSEIETPYSNDFYAMLYREFPEQMERMKKYGRQNVSWSTVAPTGSGSILGQTTGGIEPLFMPFYKRRKKCVLDTDRVDFVDVDGEKFTEYFVVHVPFMKFCETKFNVQLDHWHNITEEELQEMFKQSPYYGNTAPELNVDDRIGMQELIQYYTSSAISSTINLPAETTQEQIAEIYLKAAKHNLKGVTIYRDGSRGGVLVSSKQEGKSNFFEEVKAPKRPDELPSELHRIKYNGDDYCVIIGLYNEKPYECFVCCIDDMPEDVNFPIKGTTIKVSSGKYNFESDELSIQDIQICDPDQKIAGFLISDMMRHRIPLKRIIKTITKTEFLVTSYWTKLSKIIASYIPDGEFSGEYCPDCWELYKQKVPFRYENGCCICPNGHSKC